MDSNIYSPPRANLNIIELPDSDTQVERQNDYYVVASKKFYLLFFSTLGFYQVYWFYKNWQLFKARTNAGIWPVMRAIFSIFFIHSLLTKVDNSINESGREFEWDSNSLATTLVLLKVLENLMDKLSTKNIGSPFTDILTLVIIPIIGWKLHSAQQAINIACNDPDGESNQILSRANYIWIGIGWLMWGLAIFGLYIAISS